VKENNFNWKGITIKSFLLVLVLAIVIFLGFSWRSSVLLPARTLVISFDSSPRTMDPAHATSTFDGILAGMMYLNLIRFDAESRIVLDAAKYYSVSEDGRTYQFYLRENLKFTDGRSLTAEDVSFSFHRLVSPETNSPRASLLDQLIGYEAFRSGRADSIAGIKIDGEYRISFELKRPYAPFLSILTLPNLAIVSKYRVEKGDNLSEVAMASGPYQLSEWHRESDILLTANPNYQKPGNLEAVQLRILKDPFTMVAEFRRGNVHIIEVPNQELEQFRKEKFILQDVEEYNLYFIGLNMKNELFADEKIRQSLMHSLDRAKILQAIQLNQGYLADSPVPKGLPGYIEDDGFFAFDEDKARQLLGESSYDGRELRLLAANNPRTIALCEVFKQYFEKIGLKIRLVFRDWNAFTEELVKGEFDLFYRNWVADYPDGDNFLYPLYHTESFGLGGNYTFYSNPELDDKIQESRREVDYVQRHALLQEGARMARDGGSRILLWYKTKTMAVNQKVQNFVPHPVYNSNRYIEVNLLVR
jgi:peptide/nickel transport system substrate-binding protein/oligopeptide transport system substrate-binding protein